jgi:hypothetical protein
MRSGRMLVTAGRHLPSTAIDGRPMTDSTNTKKPSGIPPGRGSNQQESTSMTMNTSRCVVLAGAATLLALAVPGFACVPDKADPIFAAIENYKRAIVFYSDCL